MNIALDESRKLEVREKHRFLIVKQLFLGYRQPRFQLLGMCRGWNCT